MALHLYAVVLGEHALPECKGIRNAEVDLVRSGEVAAVVSAVEANIDVTEADAIAHLDVITSLLATGPVVPMRFGTIAPDAEAVRHEVLVPSRVEFGEHLRATADVIEVLVTIHVDEAAALRAVVSREDRLGAASRDALSMPERIAFGEEIAQRLSAAVHAWSDELVQPACAHADAVTPLDTPDHTSARYALLVRRSRLADVDKELHRLPPTIADGTVPYDVEYVGPLPPLDFPLPASADHSGSSLWGW